MKYKITAPNKGYNGDSAGIHFSNGVAITEKEQDLDWLRSKGYTVELQDDQPFVVDNKEIGKVEGEYITITDPKVIKETMEDMKTSENKAESPAAAAASPEGSASTESPAAASPEGTVSTEGQAAASPEGAASTEADAQVLMNKPLSDMSFDELQKFAGLKNVDITGIRSKVGIIEAIEAANAQ